MKPRFFRSSQEFRDWLDAHHDTADELLLGFYKKTSGTPGISYPESVDEALAFGWIDGVRKSLDERRYTIRFTPRKPNSKWSAINVRRVGELTAAGRMKAPGLEAFNTRDATKPAGYSYEQRPIELAAAFVAKLRKNARAWKYFQGEAPWYRRTSSFWVMSAKREETQSRRFETLLACSAKGVRVPPLAYAKGPTAKAKA